MDEVDVLGLGMLGCVRRSFELLEEYRGQALDIATIPAEDPKTDAMIRQADTLGTFQIEKPSADVDAAAVEGGDVLRSGGASRHRAAGADPGRHSALMWNICARLRP